MDCYTRKVLTNRVQFLPVCAIDFILRQKGRYPPPMSTNADVLTPESSPDDPLPITIDFVLLPHFSLLTFTAAADALTTANLVNGRQQFRFRTLALDEESVISDLGIRLPVDHVITHRSGDVPEPLHKALSVVLVCGGYRCNLEPEERLSQHLRAAEQSGSQLGGLWNGIVAIARASLMAGYACALHPDNHARVSSEHPEMLVRRDTLVLDRGRLSAAGPSSAFEMMLVLIGRHDSAETVQSIRRILKADTTPSRHSRPLGWPQSPEGLPGNLQSALRLMRNRLDDPVSKQDLARHINLSTRAMERLFQRHLDISPARCYRQLRLQRAHELLSQGDMPVGEVCDTCGFVSQAHFSRSFHRHFGVAPSSVRRSISALLEN